MSKNTSRFGKLLPQYNFFLNPYQDQRFTRCPKCEAKTGQKKVPLVIHVDPHHPVSLNYTCRYCAHCDLLMAHLDEIEHLLASLFAQMAPEVIGNAYLVLSTFDRSYWKEGAKLPARRRICSPTCTILSKCSSLSCAMDGKVTKHRQNRPSPF